MFKIKGIKTEHHPYLLTWFLSHRIEELSVLLDRVLTIEHEKDKNFGDFPNHHKSTPHESLYWQTKMIINVWMGVHDHSENEYIEYCRSMTEKMLLGEYDKWKESVKKETRKDLKVRNRKVRNRKVRVSTVLND